MYEARVLKIEEISAKTCTYIYYGPSQGGSNDDHGASNEGTM
jgi:hypothetical protein